MEANHCQATNARGKRCGKRAARGRFCLVHAGEQDMRELGRKGGSRSPLTKLRNAADDDLREKAKAALIDALEGDDEKRRFEAAKSLYSFRAAVPPTAPAMHEDNGLSLRNGRRVVGLADLLELCLEPGGIRGVFDSARMQDVILRAAEQVHELQAAGVRVETPKP